MILAALFSISSGLGYALPAIIGLESLGVPSPGETSLLLAAVLASQGKLQIWLVIVIACASAILGDNIAYVLGRRLGRDVLTAPGPFRRHRQSLIRLGDRFFDRHGSRTVFLGRWVTVVRSVVAWLAGINEMPFHIFFMWNALGGITWATAYGLAGYFGGNAAVKVFKTVGLGAAIAIGAGLLLAYVVYKVRERRHASAHGSEDGSVPDVVDGSPPSASPNGPAGSSAAQPAPNGPAESAPNGAAVPEAQRSSKPKDNELMQ